jgi:hypothetical protein
VWPMSNESLAATCGLHLGPSWDLASYRCTGCTGWYRFTVVALTVSLRFLGQP